MESLDGLGNIGIHGISMDGIGAYDTPGITVGSFQLPDSMEESSGNLSQSHGGHLSYGFNMESEPIHTHGMIHDPMYMSYTNVVAQDEKPDNHMVLYEGARQQPYNPMFLPVPSPMATYQLLQSQQSPQHHQQQQTQQQQSQHQHPLSQQPQQQSLVGLADLSSDNNGPDGQDRRSRNQGAKTRRSYTTEFKLKAIEMYDQLQSISPAAQRMGLPKKGGRKMLRDWVKNRDKIAESQSHTLEDASHHAKPLKKLHPGKKPVLTQQQEECIQAWYKSEQDLGRTVSNSDITTKAKEIAANDKFKASSRWLMRFKRNMGMHGPSVKQDRKRLRVDTSGADLSGLDAPCEYPEESDPQTAFFCGDIDLPMNSDAFYQGVEEMGMAQQQQQQQQQHHHAYLQGVVDYGRPYTQIVMPAQLMDNEPKQHAMGVMHAQQHILQFQYQQQHQQQQQLQQHIPQPQHLQQPHQQQQQQQQQQQPPQHIQQQQHQGTYPLKQVIV